MELTQYDVVVVGAGPVGLYTAYYCGLRKLKTAVCDSLDFIGGQLHSLYPEKVIYDLPGFTTITADGFIQKLSEQLKTIESYIDYHLGSEIKRVDKTEAGFRIHSGKEIIETKSVILANGNGSFQPRTLELENEAQFKNIQYYIHHLEDYRNKDVLIFGGGDSALDWSFMLGDIAQSVTLIHRRDMFRAKEGSVERLMNSKVNVLTSYIPVELTGKDSQLQQVTVENVKTKERQILKADDVIVSYGVVTSLGFLKDWEIELNHQKVVVNHQQQTSIPGVFACGDVCFYEGREIQITTGLGEGLMASASAYRYLYPEKASRPIR